LLELNLEKYYFENNWNIEKKEWEIIKSNFSKIEIKEELHRIFDKINPIFPYPIITENDGINDFEKLKKLNGTELFKNGVWNPKLEYKHILSSKYISRNLTGRKSSALFMDKERYSVGCYNKSSLVNSWTNKKARDKTFDAIFSLGLDHLNNTKIREAMRMKHYLPSQFSPSASKALYQFFNAKIILDMSSGWGDRLVGSCGLEYHGFDPNSKLTDKYKYIINLYNLNAKIECCPFEDSNLQNNYYDIMFSSPPYFDRESYSQEENQSSNRYKTIDEWLNKFLFVSIDKTYNALKKGGILAINISDILIGKKRLEICDPMNNYISSKNMEYIGCFGLQLTKMLNSKSYYMQGIFGEPIWIWKK
jgi:hypothetical protein